MLLIAMISYLTPVCTTPYIPYPYLQNPSASNSVANMGGTASPAPVVSPTASFVSAPTVPTPAPITGSTSPGGGSVGKGI